MEFLEFLQRIPTVRRRDRMHRAGVNNEKAYRVTCAEMASHWPLRRAQTSV